MTGRAVGPFGKSAPAAANRPRLSGRLGPHAGDPFRVPEEADPLAREYPWLAALRAASVRGRIAGAGRAGQPVLRFGDRIDAETVESLDPKTPRAGVASVSVHANVCVPARDLRGLERL